MKDISQYLTPVYYTILSGLGLPVYDGIAPSTEKGSYILIGEIQSSQQMDKGAYMFTVNILIDICIKNANFGFSTADNYANLVAAAINSDNQPNLSPNFQVVRTSLLSSNRLTGMNNTEATFRRLMRYEHSIVQL